jgi:O-Antigen ligase
MFAIPAILALLCFAYVRPQEFVPNLDRVPLLYILVALALTGLWLDVRLRYTKLTKNPLLPWVLAHIVWSLLSMAVMARHSFTGIGTQLVVAFIIFFVLSQGAATFRGLATAGAGIFVISLFIALVGFHQGFAPLECVRPDDRNPDNLVSIGTPCTTTDQCKEIHDREDVGCEHVGLIATTSIGKRVRYRGMMQDPNELALVASMTIPFAFALFELRRSLGRLFLSIFTFFVIAVVDVFTRSRSGQLAFLAVNGVYLLRRLGWIGVGLAGLAGVPILLLGGRSGSEADESTNERLGFWAGAIQMARDNPFLGVGMGQFTEYEALTAHNSLMLALGETGFAGLFLWTALVYMAFKITISVLRGPWGAEAYPARVWGTALLAALAGFSCSAFFLSLTDHYVFWVLMGFVGALYGATARHDPRFTVQFRIGDLVAVGAIDTIVVIGIHFYTRAHGY